MSSFNQSKIYNGTFVKTVNNLKPLSIFASKFHDIGSTGFDQVPEKYLNKAFCNYVKAFERLKKNGLWKCLRISRPEVFCDKCS